MFRVTYTGNAYNAPGTVDNYLLYRCSELTLESGYDYFMILEDRTTTVTNGQNGPIVGGITYAGTSTSGRERTVTIQMRKGVAPAEERNTFDARKLKEYLKGKI